MPDLPQHSEGPARAPNRDRTRLRGYSRIELLASLGGLLTLLFLALPTLGARRGISDLALCHSSQRALVQAWLLYAEDHAGRLVGNLGFDSLQLSLTNRGWAVGRLDNTTYRNEHTNLATLRDALLGRYLDSLSVFRCPLDPSLHRGTNGVPRVRSVSMNHYVGTTDADARRTLSDFSAPPPSRVFVFLEEREDSIDDPDFLADAFNPTRTAPEKASFRSYPGDWHDGTGVLGFADGHAESWRWRDPRTRPPHRTARRLEYDLPSPRNADIERLQAAALPQTTP